MYLHIQLLVFVCILLCVSMCVYVCDYDRASVSGLLRPFLSCGFYPLKSSFIHSIPKYQKTMKTSPQPGSL